KVPSLAVSLTCLLDVVFNFFLIFPSRTLANGLFVPGAGLGVLGAQLGTSLAFLVCMCIVMYYAVLRSKVIGLKGTRGSFLAALPVLKQALKIGVPMAMENSALCAAQVVGTKIVAPLGTAAIAANSFAVTAESICYMPGFGISSAATTLIGQSLGAKRKDLAVSFAWLSVFSAMAVMSLAGFGMYFLCPYVFAFLTPVQQVRDLGVACLRIELFAEPLFAASIAANGALRGAKDTLVPGIMNLVSIWGVRLTISFFLTRRIGLRGAWIAMAAELCVRGILFLIRLKREWWLQKA
ncbi:MAG: MATE family efflux transporter, partial [Solobacterium sp.]|nr:MATE family efflux transporter [Solobacterium sp.]